MGISESTLDNWSNQGATASSKTTYASIKAALDQHYWPVGMVHEVYLQGSYPNFTNIRSNSDVDIVVELIRHGAEPLFYSNLTEEQKTAFGLSKGAFSFADIRREVIAALQDYYGAANVDATGPNAITVAATSGRLKADVLPCVTYREYNGSTYTEGIKFWNQHTNQEKINFPKIHIGNGQAKNQNGTGQRYKPGVRMMKNAREQVIGSDDNLRKKYPSYFVECLLFNVPDNHFVLSRQDTYVKIVNFLQPALKDARGPQFTTQSKQRPLFGADSTQWSLPDAQSFVQDLISLWNKS